MLNELAARLDRGYKKHYEAKMGSCTDSGLLLPYKAAGAARSLADNYDFGIELASDGLRIGYIFDLFGLDIKAVKLGRKGMGAYFKPLDELGEELEGKKLLLFDNDVVTGRTMERATRELGRFSPEALDLLLAFKHTCLEVRVFKNLRKNFNIDSGVYSSWSNLKDIRETEHGIEAAVEIRVGRYSYLRLINMSERALLPFECITNVPESVSKVYFLDQMHYDEEDVDELEKVLDLREGKQEC